MILYRCITKEEIDISLKKGYFGRTHTFSKRMGGLGRTKNNDYIFNTFTDVQNEKLHFFRFAIDAAEYLNDEKYDWDDLRLCKFDIPDELLEKGYGFYSDHIRLEYVSKENIPSKFYKKNIEVYDFDEIQLEIESNINEAIYWHSTAGKAMTMTVFNGRKCWSICGDRNFGGFVNVFLRYFGEIHAYDSFVRECIEKNQEAYDNSTILDDKWYILEHFNTDYWNFLSIEELNKLFNGIEDYYINKSIDSLEDIKYKDENINVRKISNN